MQDMDGNEVTDRGPSIPTAPAAYTLLRYNSLTTCVFVSEKERLSAPGDPKFNTPEDEFVDKFDPQRVSPPASNNKLTTTAFDFIILVAVMSIAAYLLAQAEAGAVGCYDPVCSMWHRGRAVGVHGQPTVEVAGRGGGHQRPENSMRM